MILKTSVLISPLRLVPSKKTAPDAPFIFSHTGQSGIKRTLRRPAIASLVADLSGFSRAGRAELTGNGEPRGFRKSPLRMVRMVHALPFPVPRARIGINR